jgi:hypothetical protein
MKGCLAVFTFQVRGKRKGGDRAYQHVMISQKIVKM